MAISLGQPYFLLLLIPALLLLLLFNGRKRYLPPSRGLVLGLRAVLFTLLILALAQPHVAVTVSGNSIVYLVDQSLSMEAGYGQWLEKSLTQLPDPDRAAVVAFGRDSQLYKPFSMERLPATRGEVDDQFTDIQSALQTAYSLLPASGGRVVLLSDGVENSGDALAMADMLAAAGIPVDVKPWDSQRGDDVAVVDIAIPKNTWPGQEVVVEVTVESTVATQAQLNLYWGGSLLVSSPVEISAGRQSFSVPMEVQGRSLQRVRATIEAPGDTEPRNNSMDGLTFVQAPPRVLVVEGQAGKGAALHSAWQGAGLEVETIPVQQAQLNPTALASYQTVVLADVPAYELDQQQLAALDSFVRILGGGLVATGGRTSFGMGLYQDTLLEQMLPVAMAVEEQEELPGLDMVLVIDRSGSMMGEKLNMAKNAALSALEVLKDRDGLGVISFESQHVVDMPLTSVTEADDIAAAIEDIQVGGGTVIYPALEEAVKMLEGSTKGKHIILLSDGQDAGSHDYSSLLQRAGGAGITISTIALGADADRSFMLNLAEQGNGRGYTVAEGEDLPQVFVQETIMAGGDWLVEEDFVPSLLNAAVLALSGETPGFQGYIASTAKPLAEVLMSTHRDHPLMARWQYGLGRVLAFTSDTYGMWSQQFLAHPGFSSLWLDTLNWTTPSSGGSDIALETRLDGAGVEISALSNTQLEEDESLQVTVVDDDGGEQQLELLPAGGGRFTADWDQVNQGVYLLSAQRIRDGQVVSQEVSGFAVPYPPEFQIQRHSGQDLLQTLAERTGGRVLSEPGEVHSADRGATHRPIDITWWLLLTALILWPVDIAFRRLGGLPPKRKKNQPPKVSPGQSNDDKADETMERLLAAKKRH